MNSDKKKFNNYAFIDGQNLHETVKKLKWYFCYHKFFDILRDHYSVSKAFYFIGYTQDRNCELYRDLRSAGFQLSLRKPIRYLENGEMKIKANVDSNLIASLLMKLNRFDKAVIVAGDSDYYLIAKYLARQDKLFKILLPSRSDSSNLYRSSLLMNNKIVYVNKMEKYFLKRNG